MTVHQARLHLIDSSQGILIDHASSNSASISTGRDFGTDASERAGDGAVRIDGHMPRNRRLLRGGP